MWQKYYKNKVSISITDPVYKHPITNRFFDKKLYNLFATLDQEGQEQFNLAIEALIEGKVIVDGKIVAENIGRKIGLVQKTLVLITAAKVNTLVRLAENKLIEENSKVIIVCPYLDSQQLLADKLLSYNPKVLNGKTKDRSSIVDLFNQPNTNCRVLIITNTVGSEGISLHDTDGGYPRTMFIVPTHHFLHLFQAAGRTYRRGMMSDTEVNIVYSNHGVIESMLIHALLKTEIANLVLNKGVNRLYPGTYPYKIEDCEHKEKIIEMLDKEKQKAEKMLEKYQL